MEERRSEKKIHVVFIPYPSQGHITPMLHLAKILNSKGINITFFNSEHNHACFLTSRGPASLTDSSSFCFKTYSDGLPPPPSDKPHHPRPAFALMRSLEFNSKKIFEKLVLEISSTPQISAIIIDVMLPFPLEVAQNFLDQPLVLFSPMSPSCFLAYSQLDALFATGILPFSDNGFMTDGSLEVQVDFEPVSMKGMRLRDLPSYIRTTERNNHVFNYMNHVMIKCKERPIIFNTFKALDHEVLKDLSKILYGQIFAMGPLHNLLDNITQQEITVTNAIGSNIWKEDSHCLKWLDSQKLDSVIYVSFGSTTVMTREQLIEFAWGIANSKHPFLWVIRPDSVVGGESTTILPVDFQNECKGRGLIVSWCPQEKVLKHSSIAVFLTHCGWGSVLETISSGVPIICWPYEGEHQLINWFSCYKWGIGLELDIFVKRDQVESHIREVLEKNKGRKLKCKSMEWKKVAKEATSSSGSSSLDIDMFINYVATSLQHVKD